MEDAGTGVCRSIRLPMPTETGILRESRRRPSVAMLLLGVRQYGPTRNGTRRSLNAFARNAVVLLREQLKRRYPPGSSRLSCQVAKCSLPNIPERQRGSVQSSIAV